MRGCLGEACACLQEVTSLDLGGVETVEPLPGGRGRLGGRVAKTCLDAIRAEGTEIEGITTYTAYISVGGVAVTPLHNEGFGLGSSLELVCCRHMVKGGSGPRAVKVWICLADPEMCLDEYRRCLNQCE